jgi:hypothetical protein
VEDQVIVVSLDFRVIAENLVIQVRVFLVIQDRVFQVIRVLVFRDIVVNLAILAILLLVIVVLADILDRKVIQGREMESLVIVVILATAQAVFPD